MGVAACQRGNELLRRQIDALAIPVELDFIEHLNRLVKYPDAGTPMGAVRISYDDRGKGRWWVECPVTGYGFFYPTIREAVRRWRIVVTGYDCDSKTFIAEPMPAQTVQELLKIKLSACKGWTTP